MPPAEQKLKSVRVYVPVGPPVEVPGNRVRFTVTGEGSAAIDVLNEDGSIERFVGLPYSLKTEPANLVETVPRMPPGLVGGPRS